MGLRDVKAKSKLETDQTVGEATGGSASESKKEKAIRFVTRDEIAIIIQVLLDQEGKDGKKHPKFYYWRSTFKVSETGPPQLLKKEKERKKKGKVTPAVDLIVIPVEDMFDKCMEVHKNVGKTGRTGMEMEAAKFFSNMSREIIIRFLKYSEEYQVKRKKTINHGLVVKPLISSYYNSLVQID